MPQQILDQWTHLAIDYINYKNIKFFQTLVDLKKENLFSFAIWSISEVYIFWILRGRSDEQAFSNVLNLDFSFCAIFKKKKKNEKFCQKWRIEKSKELPATISKSVSNCVPSVVSLKTGRIPNILRETENVNLLTYNLSSTEIYTAQRVSGFFLY